MPRLRHKVLEDCYFGGCIRTPEKRNIVAHEPFEKDKLPHYLEPMDYYYDDDGKIVIKEGADKAAEEHLTEDQKKIQELEAQLAKQNAAKKRGNNFVSAEDDSEDDSEEEDEPKPVKASDAAKKLAEEFTVNLEDIKGTGKDGAITKDDVQRFIDENSGDAE